MEEGVTNSLEFIPDKRFNKLKQLQKLMLSYCYRKIEYEPHLNELNDLERRRGQRKTCAQALIIIKMYSITLAELIDDVVLSIKWIERERLVLKQMDYLSCELEWLHNKLNELYQDRSHTGEAILKLAYLLRNLRISLSEIEIKNVLSLSKPDWDKHESICSQHKVNKRDIFNVLILSVVGPPGLRDQVLDAALQHVFSDEKTRRKIAWNAESLFGSLI